eukprot:snap_masked-scaffold_10-processed-gene-9.5-mRNA-1 protein AED:1.00 eAED:1.00 QI:0/-1/0/0/-1/1/1/0/107
MNQTLKRSKDVMTGWHDVELTRSARYLGLEEYKEKVRAKNSSILIGVVMLGVALVLLIAIWETSTINFSRVGSRDENNEYETSHEYEYISNNSYQYEGEFATRATLP